MKKSAYLAVLSSALIAACGGEGPSTSALGTVTSLSPSLSACFELKPGVKYLKSDGYKQLVVQETFEGATAFGNAELRADDTRFGTFYTSISGGFINLLGIAQYDDLGVTNGKNVYSSNARIPVDVAPGQTIQLSYTETVTRTSPPSVSSINVDTPFTFISVENLTLGGRVFTNTCKIKASNGLAGQAAVAWYAQGFGMIASELQDSLGVTVKDTRVELVTILANP